MKVFRAYAKNRTSHVADTPRKAAQGFFDANPGARKCDVTEGKIEKTDGVEFFVTVYGRVSEGNWPQSFKEVTKKTLGALPDGIEKS